jgi:YD repeat-containing protein
MLPEFQAVTLTNTTLSLIGSTEAGGTYRVEYNSNLSSTTWTDPGGAPTATAATVSIEFWTTRLPVVNWAISEFGTFVAFSTHGVKIAAAADLIFRAARFARPLIPVVKQTHSDSSPFGSNQWLPPQIRFTLLSETLPPPPSSSRTY